MKVSCLQENLAKGLSIVGKAVASRSALPVLANVMLTTDNGRLRLAATNLEIGVNCWIGAKVEDEGSITIPARLLSDFVNTLPQETIELELIEKSQTLHIRCARFESNIKGIDSQEFPIVPTADEDGDMTVTLPAASFREMIDQVAFAASADESRPILTGVLIRFEAEKITMVAADGYRMSVRTSDSTGVGSDGTTEIVVPARTLVELGRISQAVPADEEEQIQLIITEARNQVLFHMTDVDLVSQLIEGNFPDFNRIMPPEHSTHTVVDRESLLKAVRVAHLFSRDAAHIVRLNFIPGNDLTPGHITLNATSTELEENVGEVDANVEGNPVEIAFNAKYLMEVLSVLKAPQVSLGTTTDSSPCTLKTVGQDEENFTHVIMPMHIAR